jgi:hypothetical protein
VCVDTHTSVCVDALCVDTLCLDTLCVDTHTSVCVDTHTSVCVDTHTHTPILYNIYMYIYIYIYTYIHIYIYNIPIRMNIYISKYNIIIYPYASTQGRRAVLAQQDACTLNPKPSTLNRDGGQCWHNRMQSPLSKGFWPPPIRLPPSLRPRPCGTSASPLSPPAWGPLTPRVCLCVCVCLCLCLCLSVSVSE